MSAITRALSRQARSLHIAAIVRAGGASATHASHSSSASIGHQDHSSRHHGASDHEEHNGWFLGEYPGYKGDELPGGVSRRYGRIFVVGMTVSVAAMVWAAAAPRETDPYVWAKEHVLNKEKYRAPEKAQFP